MRVLVAGWIGSTNLGDELVFAGLRRLLAARGVEVAAISRDPDHTLRVHGVGAVSHRDPHGVLRAIGSADAVLFGGGGLLQDTTSPFNLPYHLSRVVAARLRARPVAAVGLGAGALDTRLGRWETRTVMGTVREIAVRDRASQQLLTNLGLPQVHLAADLAFALGDLEPEPPPLDGAERLVVCLRPWSGQRGKVPAQLRGDPTPEPYVQALAAALDRVALTTELAVRFVALQSDRDDAFHRRVAGHMRCPSTFAMPSLEGIMAEVAQSSVVVSMRFHGGVVATLANRPVVLIDYAAKVRSLAEDLGEGARLLPFDQHAVERLPAAVEALRGRSAVVAAGRLRLVERQRVNAEVVDRLLSRA